MIDKPNVLIRIHKDGRILYSVRISMVLSCPMYLHVRLRALEIYSSNNKFKKFNKSTHFVSFIEISFKIALKKILVE